MVGIVEHQDAGGLAAILALDEAFGEAPLQGGGLLGMDRVAPQGEVGNQ